MNDYQIGSPFERTGAVIKVTIENAETCSYRLSVLSDITTGRMCGNPIITHPLSLYRLVFANLAKINATLSSLGRPTISTRYPYRSSDMSQLPPGFVNIMNGVAYGTFNMATGQEEDSIAWGEGVCGFPFPPDDMDWHDSNNLIIEEFSCRGDVCN